MRRDEMAVVIVTAMMMMMMMMTAAVLVTVEVKMMTTGDGDDRFPNVIVHVVLFGKAAKILQYPVLYIVEDLTAT